MTGWSTNGWSRIAIRVSGLPGHESLALTVAEFINKYEIDSEKHYPMQDGTPTGSIETIKAIMKRLRERYGDYAANEFRPLAFKEFAKSVFSDGCSRTYVNYTNDSYRRAIQRACVTQYGKEDKTNCWTPNQLRHAIATEVRVVEKSLESVAAVLGDANINSSDVYAERNAKLAISATLINPESLYHRLGYFIQLDLQKAF